MTFPSRTNTRTFSLNKQPFTWKLYPRIGREQKLFECRDQKTGGVIASYHPLPDQPDGEYRAEFRVVEGAQPFFVGEPHTRVLNALFRPS